MNQRIFMHASDLVVATDAMVREYVSAPDSETRAALDAVYDKTRFASQAEAQSGTATGVSMSPLRTRQAIDSRFPALWQSQRASQAGEVAIGTLGGTGGSTSAGFHWAVNFGVGHWNLDDPTGVVRQVGNGIVVDRAGVYEASITLAGGISTGSIRLGWVNVASERSQRDLWQGTSVAAAVAGEGVAGSSTLAAVRKAAGSMLIPVMYLSEATFFGTSRPCRFSVRRVGA